MDNYPLHEVSFVWPHTDATDVIVTGSFDQWSSSIHLVKGPSGFEAKVRVPWGERVPYKFIVDGRWVTRDDQPTEPDQPGNINNIYVSPSKPESPTLDKVPPAVVESTPIVPEVADNAPPSSEALPGAYDIINENNATVAQTRALSETADSIIGTVRDGTSAALGYIASGLGAAVQNVTGGTSDKVPEGPIANGPSEPPTAEVVERPTSPREVLASEPEVAPVVPIPILPVNDNTTTDEPLPPASTEPELTNGHPITKGEIHEPSTHAPAQDTEPERQVPLNVLVLAPVASEESSPPKAKEESISPPTNGAADSLAAEASTHGPVVLPSPAPGPDAAASPVAADSEMTSSAPETSGAGLASNGEAANGAQGSISVSPPGLPEPDKTETVNGSERPTVPSKDASQENATEATTPSRSPKTPVKEISFPNAATPDATPSSKFSTASSRKKRKSFIGKVKSLFHHKDKKKQ